MPSNKRNSITAKAMGLIFALFDMLEAAISAVEIKVLSLEKTYTLVLSC